MKDYLVDVAEMLPITNPNLQIDNVHMTNLLHTFVARRFEKQILSQTNEIAKLSDDAVIGNAVITGNLNSLVNPTAGWALSTNGYFQLSNSLSGQVFSNGVFASGSKSGSGINPIGALAMQDPVAGIKPGTGVGFFAMETNGIGSIIIGSLYNPGGITPFQINHILGASTYSFTEWADGSIAFLHNVTETNGGAFTGNASGLTNINASNLTGGPITNASSGTFYASNAISGGNFPDGTVTQGITNNAAGSLYLMSDSSGNRWRTQDGQSFTNLNASNLASGTVPLGQIPAAVVTNNGSQNISTSAFLSSTVSNFSVLPSIIVSPTSGNYFWTNPLPVTIQLLITNNNNPLSSGATYEGWTNSSTVSVVRQVSYLTPMLLRANRYLMLSNLSSAIGFTWEPIQ